MKIKLRGIYVGALTGLLASFILHDKIFFPNPIYTFLITWEWWAIVVPLNIIDGFLEGK